ncbi:MAG: HAMP domain-containing sensor histidine kinase, partial [Gammaproteobacteria bacterium]
SLIDNVLNNASTEVGNKLVVEKDEIDLREQITAAKNILNPYLESANIRVNIVIHDSTPSRIGCDGTKLQQVIINLIKNSIKHSKTANQIIIEVSEKNGQIYIAISDNGEGVPKNSHEKIFEVFHKGKDNSSGFGLGLHIYEGQAQEITNFRR